MRSLLTAATLLVCAVTAQADEVRLVASNAVKELVHELIPAFEKASGHHVEVTWGGTPDIARLVREFPAQREQTEQGDLVRGLSVRLVLERRHEALAARAELALGDGAQFFPTDAALASWMAQADQGQARIVYD